FTENFSTDEPSNLANVTLSSTLLCDTQVLASGEPIEPSISFQAVEPSAVELQKDIHPTHEDNMLEDVQHPSDSGYLFTNSISEFSNSFPSESKIEDNLCSTPLQIASEPENADAESGLIENQSVMSQNASDNSQVSNFIYIFDCQLNFC